MPLRERHRVARHRQLGRLQLRHQRAQLADLPASAPRLHLPSRLARRGRRARDGCSEQSRASPSTRQHAWCPCLRPTPPARVGTAHARLCAAPPAQQAGPERPHAQRASCGARIAAHWPQHARPPWSSPAGRPAAVAHEFPGKPYNQGGRPRISNRMSQAARARARGPPCPLRPGAPSARRPRRWRPARSARRPPRPCPKGTASAGSRRLRAPRRMRLAAPRCAPAKQARRAARLFRRLWASHAALRVTCTKWKMLEHLTAVRATAPPGVLGMAGWGARGPPAPPSGRALKRGSYWPCPAWLIQNGPGFADRLR